VFFLIKKLLFLEPNVTKANIIHSIPIYKNLKKNPINFLVVSRDSKHILFPRPPGRGVPRIALLQILFCELKPHAIFWTPTINPSGRKVKGAERRKKEEKNVNRDT
jgi:hypothetical protein